MYRDFYSALYSVDTVSDEEQIPFLSSLSRSVPDDMQGGLELPLNLRELETALASMSNNKAPGDDGLPKEFYMCFWDLLVPDLLMVFNHSFKVHCLPPSLRRGVISLLDKPGDPLDPQNKRPISLLNVDYKILAKALCLRLGEVLPSLINPFQTCGVKGRSIHDNIRFLS